MDDQKDSSQVHFTSTFRYIVGISAVVLMYVVAVTFLPIPKDNIRFVDISFGFLLNLVAQAINYLTGGTPGNTSKKENKNENNKEAVSGSNEPV